LPFLYSGKLKLFIRVEVKGRSGEEERGRRGEKERGRKGEEEKRGKLQLNPQ
jgi:hypothetical protein